MNRLAVLSMHTSPLAQPGTGDGGGMNVYVRELSSALARAGVTCDVYTRATSPELQGRVTVEPGFVVHHVTAGPLAPVPKDQLYELVDEFANGVERRIATLASAGKPTEVLHANYWLSGVAGHRLKHRLDLPLVVTFHTLDRVKAVASPDDVDTNNPLLRAESELSVIGCSDAVLASCAVEVSQLVELYDADASRVEIVAPGVDHAFFAPGDRIQARRAIGVPLHDPMLLFVGRIQPLKGAGVALRCLRELIDRGFPTTRLVVVGGPSGPSGDDELARLYRIVEELDISDRVQFVPPQPHELLSTYYRAANCCIVPSRSESFGLVALEAAACGTPVVASAVGGLTSLIEDGHTGFLVEGRSVDTFADRVGRVLADDALATLMSKAAAVRSRSYTWTIAAARLRRLYADLSERALVECV